MTADLLEKPRDELDQYMQQIRRYPRLTQDEERALAERCAQGDEEAIRQMVDANLRLVVSVAREYAGRGVPLMDLVQEGSIGLLVAAKKYDYTLQYRFSTYATKWIRQGISRCLSNHGMIRVPAYTAEKIRKVLTARETLKSALGAEPTTEQLAQACEMPEQKIEELLRLNPEVCSLDVPVGDGDEDLSALLENVHAAQPYEEVVRQELNHAMDTLLSALNDRQRQLLRLRFGMEDGKCWSLEQIGKALGVSKERARQIEKQAMEKLQKMGSSMGLEEFLK